MTGEKPQDDPQAYGLTVNVDALELEVFKGQTAIVSPAAPLIAGKLAVLWPANGSEAKLVRLPQDTAVPLNTFKAVHQVIGIYTPDDLIDMIARRKSAALDPA